MATASIAGSARVQGTARTAGAHFEVNDNQDTHPAVKRAMIFWFVAVGVLFVFHVGGARFE